MARIGQPAFFYQPGDRGSQSFMFQVDRSQRLFTVEVRTTMKKPLINELVKGCHSRSICKNRQNGNVLAYELGCLVLMLVEN